MGVGVVFLEPDALGPIDLQLLVELLDGTDCQAGVPDCVALDLVGGGFRPLGQVGKDILLDFQPGRLGGTVGGEEFDGAVVGEAGGVKPEFKLGLLLPVWADSDLPGFPCGTFGVRWLWQRRQ